MNRRFWTEGPGSFILAILLALFVRWALIEAYVIPSTSMLPTLLVNDHIFINKIHFGLRLPLTERWLFRADDPHPGDVIVFRLQDKSQFYIKRVIGVPGDRVFYENGNLYVNEQVVDRRVPELFTDAMSDVRNQDFPGEENFGGKDNYVHWEEVLGGHPYSVLLRREQPKHLSFGPYIVPEGHYFVMGDNRNHSQDSREWEDSRRFVPRDHVIGRAIFVWLSCEKTFASLPFLCNPLTIRWSRIGQGIH